MTRSFRIHLNIEKEYIILCIKKWFSLIEKTECIPKIDFNFYLNESINVLKNETKNSTILYGVIDDKNKTQLEIDIYIEIFCSHLQKSFNQNKILVIYE